MSIEWKQYNDLEKILIEKSAIEKRVYELGSAITADYQGRSPVMISVLKGSIIFFSDLIRAISLPLTTQFISVSSYGENTASSGKVSILNDMIRNIEDKDVIIVEDIIDSGRTLSCLKEKLITEKKARTVSIVTLLDKPSRRQVELHPEYTGFVIEDAFVVGYGLDYAEKYRNLPDIGILSPRIYE